MDRNTTIGFVLIAAILILFAVFNKPKKQDLPVPKPTTYLDTHAKKIDTSEKSTIVSATATDSIIKDTTESISILPVEFRQFEKGDSTDINLENELLKIKISPKGGVIDYVELKKYKTFDQKPLILVNSKNLEFNIQFPFNNQIIKTSDLFYKAEKTSAYATGKDSQSLSVFLKLNDKQYIEHIYTIYGNRYMVGFKVKFVGFDAIIPKNVSYLDLNWKTNITQLEKSFENERNATTVYYRYAGEKPNNISERKSGKEELRGKIQWVSFKQQFFNQSLITEDYFIRGMVESTYEKENKQIPKTLSTTMSFAYNHKPEEIYHMKFFFGPNHYQTLKRTDLELQYIIPLGWGIFGWVNKFVVIPVFNFLSKYILNYGLIILILTILIKIVLLPLTYKSYLSTARMKVLKPEIDELKAKFGKDQTRFQTEQLKLYRRAGVSPLGGCLPMLLQLPILIAMFRFFPSSIELRQEAFLWAKDLSTYDSIWTFPNGFSIPFYGDHVSLWCLLMTISTIIYTKMNNDMMSTGGEMQKQMRIISYVMPVMFLGFFNSYSSALSYYYFLANVLTFGQQYLFKSAINEDKLLTQIEANKLKKVGTKSKWQIRLEEMQRKQLQQRKGR